MSIRPPRKVEIFNRTQTLASTHSSVVLFSKTNVKKSLINAMKKTNPAVKFLFGKGTTIKKALSELPTHKDICPFIKNDVALAFTDLPLLEVKNLIESLTYPAYAKEGAIAQKDVYIPKGPTGMGPEKTSYFQALDIPTKIANSQVEVTTDFKILSEGKKVGGSEAGILALFGMMPFNFGAKVKFVKEKVGEEVFGAELLEITVEDIKSSVFEALKEVRAIVKESGIVNELNIREEISGAIRESISISLITENPIEEAKKALECGKMAKEAINSVEEKGADEKKEEEKQEEENEETEEDLDLDDIFG